MKLGNKLFTVVNLLFQVWYKYLGPRSIVQEKSLQHAHKMRHWCLLGHCLNQIIGCHYFYQGLATPGLDSIVMRGGMHCIHYIFTADRLAQLVECQTTVREVSGSSPRPDQHSVT